MLVGFFFAFTSQHIFYMDSLTATQVPQRNTARGVHLLLVRRILSMDLVSE